MTDHRHPGLHVLDLDGTLLRSDATLGAYARDGLNALLDAGTSLTVASARSAVAIRSLLAGVRLTLPVIELNGAFLTDLASTRHLAHRTLGPDTATAALDALTQLGAEPVLTTWDGTHDRVLHGPCSNSATAWYAQEKRAHGDPRISAYQDPYAEVVGTRTAAVIAFVPDEQAKTAVMVLEEALGATATVLAAANRYVPGWTEVQVAHPEAEKGFAVRELVRTTSLGHLPLTVYGDHLNDLPMFAVADRAVAPANAHPDVLARATVVTAANDEDGIVRYLLDGAAGLC
ncbi:HAD hydrolase family protein [Streptomyces sp. SID12501]|uniref:HAD hydrolase family protein n=1 Tax=Streptomyces sp. SID12501 TaxID=2706042 RepID=A0A6B3BVI5_9ACTN|nr:HAD hydrolase family protein [Streptomyces sp. SID12501]NEC88393.1 HAD hydrolase family protein [Streptomyces sp. SID12501]